MSWVRLYATYHRFTGSWAFILHRLSGLALIGYLFVHIYSLKGLQVSMAQLPPDTPIDAHPWTDYVAPYASGIFLVLEWALFGVVLFHAFNGVRIAVVDLANGSKYHKELFWILSITAAVLFVVMGWLMLAHVFLG